MRMRTQFVLPVWLACSRMVLLIAMACRLGAILAILSVSVLVARGSAVLCTTDLSDPCKCSYIDERDVTWVIDISDYFQYP